MPIHLPRLTVRRLGPLLLCATAALVPLGCQQNEDVQHYQAPRIEAPMIRLRVAIFKSGDSTWFFKLTGPKDVVDQHADEFEQLLRSVKFSGDAKEPATWIAPDAWVKEPAGELRYAAYNIGPKDTAAEMTVVRLGGAAGSLVANVNRWRGQLGLKAIAESDLGDYVTEQEFGDRKVSRVDMTAAGRFRKAAPPKMGITKGQAKPRLTYDAPKSWKKMPTAPQFAEVGFQVQEGDEKVLVSASEMTAQPLLDNVLRWRGQVGLGRITTAELKDIVQPFAVGDTRAESLDMAGKSNRIVVVLLPRGDRTWIFKIMGSPELVGKQKAEFENFVRSVRFDGGSDE